MLRYPRHAAMDMTLSTSKGIYYKIQTGEVRILNRKSKRHKNKKMYQVIQKCILILPLQLPTIFPNCRHRYSAFFQFQHFAEMC